MNDNTSSNDLSNVVTFPKPFILKGEHVPEDKGDEFVASCRCGSTDFNLVYDNRVECASCDTELTHKGKPVRWKNDAE